MTIPTKFRGYGTQRLAHTWDLSRQNVPQKIPQNALVLCAQERNKLRGKTLILSWKISIVGGLELSPAKSVLFARQKDWSVACLVD